MAPIIRAVLTNLISAEEASSINIIANDVEYTDEAQEGKTWKIVYRHPERSVQLQTGQGDILVDALMKRMLCTMTE